MDWLGFLLIGILAVIVGGVLGRVLRGSEDREAARHRAAMNFGTAVLAALEGIYPLPAAWPYNIDQFLREAFPALQTAVAQFRPFVPWWRRPAFDRAWLRYRCGSGRKAHVQDYHQYMSFEDLSGREKFRRNVDALLSFAK